MDKYKKPICFSIIFLLVVVFVAICSECSFLYDMNIWGDVNCFYTVAKSLLRGKVLYRDIYEQKGLYLYAVHMVAYLISNKTYIGMYIFEVIFGSIFAFSLYKVLSLYIESPIKKTIFIGIILLTYYTSPAFCQGDSAEEMMIPLYGISMYFIMKSLKNKTIMPWWQVLLSGFFGGISLFIKFTLIAFYIPFCLMIFFTAIMDKKVLNAFLYALYFLIGLLIACIPVFIYFNSHNAFYDLYEGYFYNNIFVYSSSEKKNIFMSIGLFIYSYLKSLVCGYGYNIILTIGFIWMFKEKLLSKRERTFILIGYILTNFFIFLGGRDYNYYGLPIVIFAFVGMLGIDHYLPKFKRIYNFICSKAKILLPASALAGIVLCLLLNMNTVHMFKSKDDYYQFRFKEIIEEEEDATLLNYGFLDMGLYFLCDIEPNCKYFSALNVPLQEMYDEQDRFVKEGLVTFVVSRDVEPTDVYENYELVDQVYAEYGLMMHTFYLYKLKA